jgi:uncharacterized membrane protein
VENDGNLKSIEAYVLFSIGILIVLVSTGGYFLIKYFNLNPKKEEGLDYETII